MPAHHDLDPEKFHNDFAVRLTLKGSVSGAAVRGSALGACINPSSSGTAVVTMPQQVPPAHALLPPIFYRLRRISL